MTCITILSKVCTKCGDECPVTLEYFPSDKRHNDGLQSRCRKCCRQATRKYHQQHPEKAEQRRRKYHQRYPEYYRKYDKNYRQTLAGHLRHLFQDIKQRCNNPKRLNYQRYGGHGIKCLFTSDEFVDYVIDDLGYDTYENIKGLQAHRINNDGHYEPGNIEFLTDIKHRQAHKNINNNGRNIYNGNTMGQKSRIYIFDMC